MSNGLKYECLACWELLGPCNDRVINWLVTGTKSRQKAREMTISAAKSGKSTEKISAFSVGSAV